jgi:hypothetical protein
MDDQEIGGVSKTTGATKLMVLLMLLMLPIIVQAQYWSTTIISFFGDNYNLSVVQG